MLKTMIYNIRLLSVSIVIASFFTSCKEKITGIPECLLYFDTPQPASYSPLETIPKKWQGWYINLDSTFLHIESQLISIVKDNRFSLTTAEFDSIRSEYSWNSTQIMFSKDEVYDYKVLKDSVLLTTKVRDTFYCALDKQYLRKSGSYLLVNTKKDLGWEVQSLHFEKEGLTVLSWQSFSDVQVLDSIIARPKKEIDSLIMVYSPTKKEFKKLLELKSKDRRYLFKKIKI